MINPAKHTDWYGTPYAFGIDPVWQVSENKIVFLNAFKMKISILLGVIHMSFGVCLSYWNATYFKRPLNIFAEFIPQIIFLSCMFGYLSLLMWMKWTMYAADAENLTESERCAPSILITFINMVLFKDNDDEIEPGCESGYMYSGQKHIQRLLVLIAVVCVPWMFFVKPFMQMREANQKSSARQQLNVNGQGMNYLYYLVARNQFSKNSNPLLTILIFFKGEQAVQDEPFDVSEAFILQGIHTIEYVLGSVSHTASYLRLWALSLAHAQLSEVLWNMVLRIGLSINEW